MAEIKKLKCYSHSLLMVAVVWMTGCRDNKVDGSLVDHIDSSLRTKNGYLDISKFNKVPWDKMYIIEPYTMASSLPSPLSAHKQQIMGTGIAMLDSFYLIALMNGDELVELTKVPANLIYWEHLQHTPQGKKQVVSYLRAKTNFDAHYDAKYKRVVVDTPIVR